MRTFALLLACLAVANCANNMLRPVITTPASAELQGRHIQLQALPTQNQDASAQPANIAKLTAMLREGLRVRGYLESADAKLRAYYWLDLRVTPLDIAVDQAPPAPLGPYQSQYRLHDENATLHLRLTDLQDRVLWEGQIDSSLSPAWERDQQLQKAWEALLQQLPMAR
jgi:hypothetical protein